MSGRASTVEGRKSIAENRKARHDYHILETVEAGLDLRGTEVKSLRAGLANLTGAFAAVDKGQAIMRDCHIAHYFAGNVHNHEPTRPRRLLLHRKEIDRLAGQVKASGLTLVPLRLYFVRGRAKVEIAVCRGKRASDRRETLRRREADLDARRAVAERSRGRK